MARRKGVNKAAPGGLAPPAGPASAAAARALADVSATDAELGLPGLNTSGGRVYEEFLPQLQGRKALQVYREMSSNDPTVGAMLLAIEMLCRQVPWPVEPASAADVDVETAAYVESCMHDMDATWADTLADILSFCRYGFAVREEVYKKRSGPNADPSLASLHDDGRIGWAKLAPRSQETIEEWIFDDHGSVLGLVQQAPPDYRRRTIPFGRFLLFRAGAPKNNPEGRSVLRTAYRPWYFKRRIEEIEAIGVERDLAGLPTAHVPAEILRSDATADQKALLRKITELVRNIRRDQKEGIVFPLGYDTNGHVLYKLELLSTGGRRQFDTSAIVGRYDARIAMSVLADFVLLGHEQVGSFALASSKTNLFAVALGAWLDVIVEVMNRFAIPRLLALNTFDLGRGLPKLRHGDIETIDLTQLSQYVQSLLGAGALTPNPELERYLLKHAGLPEPLEGVVAAPRGPAAAQPEGAPGGEGEPPPDPAAEPEAPEPQGPAAAGEEPDDVKPGRPIDADPDAVAASALALNGSQVTSLLEVTARVADGSLPKASAVAILQAAFALSPETASAIVDPIELIPRAEPPPPPTTSPLPPPV